MSAVIEYDAHGHIVTVEEVEVTMTVTFRMVVATEDQERNGDRSREQVIVDDVIDAIEHRAPHLTDFEHGDVTLVCTITPEASDVTVTPTGGFADDVDAAEIEDLVEGYAGETF